MAVLPQLDGPCMIADSQGVGLCYSQQARWCIADGTTT